MPGDFKSLMGQYLGLGNRGQLVTHMGRDQIDLTRPCVTATGTISAEAATAANQRDISITFKDAEGRAINYAETVEVGLFTSSAMIDFVAVGGTTGIAQGAGGNTGKLMALVAKKLFRGITSTAGVLAFIYTDTGTDVGYLAVRVPNGRWIGIGLVTNA
jgi:hypothetical protein